MSDMCIAYSAINVGDYGVTCFKHSRNRTNTHTLIKQFTDEFNFMIFEFRIAMLFAYCRSAFSLCVQIVVLLSSKKQMSRIATRWIVAFMTNTHSLRNWAVRNFKRSSIRGTESPSFHSEHAPSVRMASCRKVLPCPAFIWLSYVNLGPKTFFDGWKRWGFPSSFSSNSSGFLIGFSGSLHG